MKTTAQVFKKGFTLIELIVVIAILGVLAVVLVTTIDPLDKINSANDAGVVSTIIQLGRANDGYAATHSNSYTSGMATACTAAGAGLAIASTATNNFAGAVFDLCSAGESKLSAIAAPSASYTLYYFASSTQGSFTTCNDTAVNCVNGVFGVGPLQSKKNAAKPYFVYVNGKSCFLAAAPTIASVCP